MSVGYTLAIPVRQIDVIVVGAGPAGCAAAYDLAANGIDVLLLDRKSRPTKPCAGALTVKAVNRLRYSIAPVIRAVVRDLEVSLNRRASRVLPSQAPIAVMTVRHELDAFCLEQTVAKGARFERIEQIAAVDEDEEGVTLRTDKEALRCRYLIGADGANSQIRRLLGYARSRHALALEGEARSECATNARFDFRVIDGGYGWVFAKGDHLNVGLYTQGSGLAISKDDLRAYAKFAAGTEQVHNIRGFPVGIGGEDHRSLHERVFLAGDASGATEPLLGEGIHNAIKTGQAAAAAISAAIFDGKAALPIFRARLREVQTDLRACSTAAQWFYGLNPSQFEKLATNRRWQALMRGFAAGMVFRDIMRTFVLSRFYRVHPVQSVVEYETARRASRPELQAVH